MNSDFVLDRVQPEPAEKTNSAADAKVPEQADVEIGAEGVERVIPDPDRDAADLGRVFPVESINAVQGDGEAVVSREEVTPQGQASVTGPETGDDSPEPAVDQADVEPSPTRGSEGEGLVESTGILPEATRSLPDRATVRSVPLPDPLGVLKGRTMRFRDPVRSRIERVIDRVFEFLDDKTGDSENR